MNVDLGTGQSAELRERLSYAQAREVRRAAAMADTDPGAKADMPGAFVRAYLVSWTVLDLDGHAVPTDKIEDAPDDVIGRLADVCLKLWKGRPDPKDGGPTSPTT